MTAATPTLDLDDIQSGVLHPRPSPYAGAYILLRIDDRHDGRELLRRLSAVVASAADAVEPASGAWVSVALTYHGLKALGVPRGVARHLRLGVPAGHGGARRRRSATSARARRSTGSTPLGTRRRPRRAGRVAPRRSPARGRCSSARARPTPSSRACGDLAAGLPRAADRDASPSASGTASAIRPSRAAASRARNPHEAPLKAGEFVLGYRDEIGGVPPVPQPEVLGRNGTYVVFRKLHQRRRRVPPVPARPRRRAPRTRSCWPPRSWAAGAAARRWRSRPSTTTPSSAPTRPATTPSSTAPTTRAGLRLPARRRTSGG